MGTFVYNTGNAKAAVGEINLSFGMFFDGTLNNMKNTELRKKYLEKGNDIKPDDDEETIANKEKQHADALDRQDEKYHMYKKTAINQDNEEYLKYLRNSHRDAIDKQGTDNSYANDYTNVARKYKCCERKIYAQYIEGIGTGIGVDDPMASPNDDITKDNKHGFMYGAGKTGIRGKVRIGCKNLALKIGEEKNRKDNKNKVLNEITIDIFGFSRGAAAARNFAYEVVVKEQETATSKTKREIVDYRNSSSFGNDGVIPIYENKTTYKDGDLHVVDASALKDGKMPVRGLLGYYLISEGVLSPEELEDLSVTIRFLGIYDTVSSYEETYDNSINLGINIAKSLKKDLFKDDVAQLNLNSLRVTKAVHFTAQDEHRKNFRLTRMETGVEKNFPGVHCDIGGAYENETEVKTEIETNNHLSNKGLEDYKQHLVSEYWYTKDQLEILKDNMASALPGGKMYRYTAPYLNYQRLQGTRYIKKEYSYIPLQFMEEFFREQLADESYKIMPISCKETYQLGDHNGVLKAAYRILYEYVFEKGSELKFIPDNILNPFGNLDDKNEIENPYPEKVKDNIPQIKPPKFPILIEKEILPEPKIECDDEGNEVIVIDEVIIPEATPQNILRRLRNEYLHWSANRKWVGMEPNNGNDPTASGKRGEN
ncbi:phospholipase effector Tle1 domain-containing protein [Frigoriflavimonas asaccharolytica]|uniref:T6SS Phospholipase effector Tle1-like catalytic domain-containing protein n=1 Tax=Frigoriflavimonas asaccharolytica TaxID=2735899 RepID=A0A8J8GAK3_9FLAO|nr:DUF2235 domain-containing protein [Frigoriflavimonas asaccharolytica]NRS94058.1 hypothetical protein [Frigoriflavimonas asaccharolytica]